MLIPPNVLSFVCQGLYKQLLKLMDFFSWYNDCEISLQWVPVMLILTRTEIS